MPHGTQERAAIGSPRCCVLAPTVASDPRRVVLGDRSVRQRNRRLQSILLGPSWGVADVLLRFMKHARVLLETHGKSYAISVLLVYLQALKFWIFVADIIDYYLRTRVRELRVALRFPLEREFEHSHVCRFIDCLI